jgi:hypothetical protein
LEFHLFPAFANPAVVFAADFLDVDDIGFDERMVVTDVIEDL